MNSPTSNIAEQAAEWILALEEGDAEQQLRTRQAFQRWQAADPRHAQAADTAQAFINKLAGLKPDSIPARNTLNNALNANAHQQTTKRKPLSATLSGLALVLLVPLLLVLKLFPLAHLTADLQVRTGEWRNHTLPDGSSITLSGKSAVNIHFDETRRELQLLSGEIFVDVAQDTQRPFVVTTGFGQIEALGTRFIVNQTPTQTRLTMIESRVNVTSSRTPQASATIVKAGEQIHLDAHGLSAIEQINPAMREQSWHKQQLVVRGWPVADVLRELARYHPAYFYIDETTLPAISVSAVLPLDKPDEALQLLTSSFPAIRVRTLTPWLVLVDGGEHQ